MLVPTFSYTASTHIAWQCMRCIVAVILVVSAHFTVAQEGESGASYTAESAYLSNDLYLYADGIYDNPLNDGVSAKVSPELSAMDNLLFSMPVKTMFGETSQNMHEQPLPRMDYQLDVLMDGVGFSFSYVFR